MKKLHLERHAINKEVQHGYLKLYSDYNDQLWSYSCIENVNYLIPNGVYKALYEYSPKFDQKLWELKGIPERREIKIHPANFARQLKGCIAIGIREEDHLLYSRLAVDHLNFSLIEEKEIIVIVGEWK